MEAKPYLIITDKETDTQVDLPGAVITSMTWGEGGPVEARAYSDLASDNDLWVLVNLLRNKAEIWDRAQRVWWGYASSIQMTFSNGLRLTYSLDKMANKIRVRYSEVVAGNDYAGEPEWTTWSENTSSSAVYGTKETQLQISEATDEQAESYKLRAIREYAWPLIDRDITQVGRQRTPRIDIIMSGWISTLEWISYSNEAGKESYEDIGTGLQAFGDAAATTKVAQSIQLSSTYGWSASQVAVRVKKEGSPTDNLTVDLCPDSSGAPGTALASATLAGASVPEHLNWVTLDLSAKVSLAVSTTYWIVVRRSGANDGTNYYKVDGNEDLGYSGGSFKIWNGSAWVARGTDADMLFQVLGVIETTEQIQDVITVCGQFLSSTTQIEDSSGIYSSPYRDGAQNGLVVLRELLRSGTSNDTRLRILITPDLIAWVDEEPDPEDEEYKLQPDGSLIDAYSAPAIYPPAQTWLNLSQVLPIAASAWSRVADPTRVFIEQATWTPGGNRYRLRGMGLTVN